jgi:methylated-DNA-protein-cysteine methyltransferase related protein
MWYSREMKDSKIQFSSNGFKERVIELTLAIPRGKVTTYGTIATLAGIPRGARMVGGILHYAIDELDLPWQRVVNRIGFVSTKCLEHPRELQVVLLKQEGVEVSSELVVDLKKYGWFGEEFDGKRILPKGH